jgi:hypothetical protein
VQSEARWFPFNILTLKYEGPSNAREANAWLLMTYGQYTAVLGLVDAVGVRDGVGKLEGVWLAVIDGDIGDLEGVYVEERVYKLAEGVPVLDAVMDAVGVAEGFRHMYVLVCVS